MDLSVLAVTLNSGAGIVLALAFDYLPGLNTWYAKLSKNAKKLIMIILLAVVSAIVMSASCISIYDAVTCDSEGAMLLAQAFIQALIANQAVHKVLPETKGVKNAKLEMPF